MNTSKWLAIHFIFFTTNCGNDQASTVKEAVIDCLKDRSLSKKYQ